MSTSAPLNNFEQLEVLEAAKKYAQACESMARAPRMSNAQTVALQKMDAAWNNLVAKVQQHVR